MPEGDYAPRTPEEVHVYEVSATAAAAAGPGARRAVTNVACITSLCLQTADCAQALWRHVSPSGEAIGGAQAVAFFRESKVDGGFLKQIWALSTPAATMDKAQFMTALRYVTMAQNGEFPISKERLTKTANENLGLPRFPSITIPPFHKPVPVPVPAAVPAMAAPGASPPQMQMSPWAITPADHLKLHQIFLSYDQDKDGYLTGQEAVAVFGKSGLDMESLKLIWVLADADKVRGWLRNAAVHAAAT